MPINRLRRVLGSSLRISVDSSQSVANQVNAIARPPMNPKRAAPFPPIVGLHERQVRPIDLLRKIGEVTTPPWVNLARLSASWATRRYFWCIHDYGTVVFGRNFRLSDDARKMERHQKTLLSDEFGVGFAAFFMEQAFGASRTVDVQFALAEPADYFDVTRGPSKRTPDYLIWAPGGSVYIVECKGCQTSKSAVLSQLRRGMEQVPTIEIPGTVSPRLVIATHLKTHATTIYVLDPPNDELSGMRPAKEVERKDDKVFSIPDSQTFRTKLRRGTNLQSLRWISQHATAARLETSVGYRPVGRPTELPDAEIQTVETAFGAFAGVQTPLAPEFGFNGPLLFRGIERGQYIRLQDGNLEAEPEAPLAVPNDPRISVGPDGICLLVRNLDMET